MTYKCPKCKRKLSQSKIIHAGAHGSAAVFECMECVMYWKTDEDCFKMNLTFAVTARGMIIDTSPPHEAMMLDAA